jgi:hypothetical protein
MPRAMKLMKSKTPKPITITTRRGFKSMRRKLTREKRFLVRCVQCKRPTCSLAALGNRLEQDI